MKLTIVFPDYRISAEYANGHVSHMDFYTPTGNGEIAGNTVLKQAFVDTVSNVGHNMNDYWAIQYSGGDQEIEYANGHSNQIVSGNTGLSQYLSLVDTWDQTIYAEGQSVKATWDEIRKFRDGLLSASDKIIVWSTETGNTVPSEWTTYRQDLRDLTTTYNAPTGNTELVVFPSEPSWPSA